MNETPLPQSQAAVLGQVAALSNESLRIKVAELCGWTKQMRNYGPRSGLLWVSPEGLNNGDADTGFWLPHYEADLNAMHEVLTTKLLSDGSWSRYRTNLEAVCNTKGQDSNTAWMLEHNASARKRAEASVLTLGLKSDNVTSAEEGRGVSSNKQEGAASK